MRGDEPFEAGGLQEGQVAVHQQQITIEIRQRGARYLSGMPGATLFGLHGEACAVRRAGGAHGVCLMPNHDDDGIHADAAQRDQRIGNQRPPPRWCNTFASDELIRVPSPAANTMAPVCRFEVTAGLYRSRA